MVSRQGLQEEYCILFLGPNCIGLINTRASLNTTPACQEIKPEMFWHWLIFYSDSLLLRSFILKLPRWI